MVILPVDRTRLQGDIPIPPFLSISETSPPPSTWQWYCRLRNRCAIIDLPLNEGTPRDHVIISTPYLDDSVRAADWEVILEFEGLPTSMMASRPLFIQSRCSQSQFHVFRPDPRGWSDLIYGSSSQIEAEGLLDFLKLDRWNDGCIVLRAEERGEWTIGHKVDGLMKVLGAYPDRNDALKTAWDYASHSQVESSVYIFDRSGNQADVYVATRRGIQKM